MSDLTVFVISTGEEVLDDCLDALRAQTVDAPFELVRDVYPMSAAFQAMPERCTTPYFVQVDADMILEPDALERLGSAIRASSPRTLAVTGQLYEEGFGVGGAVKCWKRSFFRFFSFRDVRTVDRDLYRRTRRFGLRPRALDGLFGVHRPRHSSFSEYAKAKGDVEKWRFLGRPPEQYALPLVEKLLTARPDSNDGLLGALLGGLTERHRVVRSKDLRFESELHDDVRALLGAPHDVDGNRIAAEFAGAYRGREAKRAALAQSLALAFGAESAADELLRLAGR